MKTKFAARQRLAEAAEEATGEEQVEKEAKMIGEEVAMRMYGHGPITPGPAPEGYPKTPARTPAAPTTASKTPALRTPVVVPMPATPARPVPRTPAAPEPPREAKSSSSDPKETEVPKRKMARLPIPEAMRGEPARNFMSEALESEASPKKQRLEEIVGNLAPVTPPLGTKREYALPWDDEDDEKRRMSPKRRVNSIQEDFPGGDEMAGEAILQEELNRISEDEGGEKGIGKPPEVDEEELAKLDAEACRHEEERLEKMGVIEKLKDNEEPEEGSYVLTSKMVITWKHRDEKGGWFRRARLVGRQFKWSVFAEDAFAPTSASVIVRMLLRLQMKSGLALYTLDVKDAFLLMDQPEDEKALVVTANGTYRLKRNLPGQRNAAAQWFKGFCKVATEFGLVQDTMQPTMMKKPEAPEGSDTGGKLYLTIHVDDLLLVGDEPEVEKFISHMERKGWKTEKRGPLYMGSFSYLKREMELIEKGITIRPDKQHIKELAKLTNVEHRKHRTTPGDGNFNRLSKDDEPMKHEDITKYRSCVGKLLYISPDRPDVQYVAQGLAGFMQQPTKKSWQAMQHVSSYLLGTMNEGILFEHGPKGRSMLNDDDNIYEWDFNEEKKSMLEVVCDADYAGQRETRKSVSSVQIYLDGCLLESYVRSQRAIALSSGESEYVAMVGGRSEGLFLKHCWKFLTNEDLEMICRSDSSAARALAGRVGVGRTRQIAAGLLWLQQKVVAKELKITGIPTAVNTSDIGTKILSRARMSGLKYLIKMIDMDDEKIGKQQYEEIKAKEQLKKNTGKMAKMMGANAKVALVIALSLLQGQGAEIEHPEESEDGNDEAWWIRPLITMICLASIGALSLARMAIGAMKTWWHGRRSHGQPIEENESEEDENVVTRPRARNEAGTDEEKVNMQWQIVRLEVAIAEQEEKLADVRRDRDLQAREVVRMYNMCSELRFELENVKEEKDEAKRKAIRLAGTDDEKAMEMERMAEDTAKAWEVTELWKKRAKEAEQEAKQQMTELLRNTRFTLERQHWHMARTSVCYHHEGCGHLANSATTRTIKPCAHCIPDAIRAVLEHEAFPMNT